jgi:hypothetical protein
MIVFPAECGLRAVDIQRNMPYQTCAHQSRIGSARFRQEVILRCSERENMFFVQKNTFQHIHVGLLVSHMQAASVQAMPTKRKYPISISKNLSFRFDL